MNIKRKLFKLLISVYPKPYRKHFEESMLQIFDDMQHDGSASDWFIVRDAAASIPMQYINYFEETMKTKFQNIPAAVAGAVLVLPFVALIVISMSAQLLKDMGVVTATSNGIGQIIGSHIGIGIAIIVYLPLAAFLINLIALVWAGFKDRELTVKQFVIGNALSIIVMFIGFGLALFLPFHDAIPCFVHGTLYGGLGNFPQLMRTCSNA